MLDLGANIGATTAHYRYLWPDAKVVAVEPDPRNAALLRLNTDAVVREQAVSTEAGPGLLLTVGLNSQSYLLHPDGDIPVDCVTLAELIREEFVGPVDFVKMDVEGQECGRCSRLVPGRRSSVICSSSSTAARASRRQSRS